MLRFDNCTSLTSINVDALNPAYSSVDGVLFDKAQTTLLQFPDGQSWKLHHPQQRHQHRGLCVL